MWEHHIALQNIREKLEELVDEWEDIVFKARYPSERIPGTFDEAIDHVRELRFPDDLSEESDTITGYSSTVNR